jgi:hypothetical protein
MANKAKCRCDGIAKFGPGKILISKHIAAPTFLTGSAEKDRFCHTRNNAEI